MTSGRLLQIGLGGVLLATALWADEAPSTLDEPAISAADLDHWSFRAVLRPAVPEVVDAAWCRNPIDRFILSRLEAAGVNPGPEADRVTLARRLSFNLTGLPPDFASVEEFVDDRASDAYERLVDRQLTSCALGERWAQHWLDLARFAETDGFEHDLERPHAWRYRDWVVDALNSDLPYDQFVSQQIAGDELAPDDPAAAVATGFLLCGPDMPDINLQEERRHNFLNDLTGTVGSALLGLQVGCAACHDHKFDPISQHDFYRLRACFDSIEIFRDHPLPAEPGTPSEAKLLGRVVRESTVDASPSRLYLRGDFRRPGPEVTAAGLRLVGAQLPAAAADDEPPRSTRQRRRLAEWMCSTRHPLTARVIVNRVWLHHFGSGLVESASDFGKFGAEPSHPELLDWLADEFMSRGWSLKRLHQLILTSATWRLASRPPDPEFAAVGCREWRTALERDPGNRLRARFNRRRLDGEEIRDAMLTASGGLNRHRGGPGFRPPLPPEIVQTLLPNQWKPSPQPEESLRRSIYLFVRRNLRYPLFEAFDRPDTNASCAQRNRSTIAPQSLALLNSELTFASAQRCAAEILRETAADPGAHCRAAWNRILSRPPTAEESSQAVEFLRREAERIRNRPSPDWQTSETRLPPASEPGEAAALVELCLALFNANEFLTVD